MYGDRREVVLGPEGKESIRRGVDLLADTVQVTLGPKGRNVFIQRIYNKNKITKDGVTVASEFFLSHPIEDMGAQTIKEAAQKTAEEAGDGTTTSTILARSIYSKGLDYLNEDPKRNPIDVVEGIDIALNLVIKSLKETSVPIKKGTKQLEHVATISANNDEEIGKIVSDAVTSVGKEGKVRWENSKDEKTYFETDKGTVIEQGFISPHFVVDTNEDKIELHNPLIVTSNYKFSEIDDIEPFFKKAVNLKRDLLIICEELDRFALSYALNNILSGRLKIKVAIIRPPGVSNMRNFMLGDIAAITGGRFNNTHAGDSSLKFKDSDYGSAELVTVDRKQTVIEGGKGSEEAKENRIKSIQTNIKNAEKGVDDRHRERLAKMFTGISVIYIGAKSEVELGEKKDRVEDAVLATQSALAEGIVPGGGLTLHEMMIETEDPGNEDILAGINILMDSCTEPFKQILKNAGKDYETICEELEAGEGYNVKTNTFVVDMIDEGVIDPTKVVRVALENAASVAKTLLTTEASIYYSEDHTAKSVHMDPGNIK